MTYSERTERPHCADYWGFTMRKILAAAAVCLAPTVLYAHIPDSCVSSLEARSDRLSQENEARKAATTAVKSITSARERGEDTTELERALFVTVADMAAANGRTREALFDLFQCITIG